MDFKLQLLKVYLDNRIAEQEQLTGVPIGNETVQFKMLCNSDPGIISIFVGLTQPEDSKSSVVDVWYDFSVFREKAIDGVWNEFDVYKNEFTSTIIDLTDDGNVIDTPVALDIVGPSALNKNDVTSATYQCYIVLQSGNRYPLQDVTWSLQTTESVITIDRDPASGDGILDFSLLMNSANLVIRAEFDLADGTKLTKEVPVNITVEGTGPSDTYTLLIAGPAVVNSEGTANFTATLRVDLADGTSSETDVTTVVLWSISLVSAGIIDNNGLLTAYKVPSDTNVNVMATYTIDGMLLTATHPITIVNRMVQSVEILGAAQVKENRNSQYQVRVTFDNGTVEVDTLPTSWSLSVANFGTVSSTGLFTAPSVNADDNSQTIIADVLYDGNVYRATKPITIVDVVAPVMTINGPSLLTATESGTYTATIDFEGQTYDVTPTWTFDPDLGAITSAGVFTADNITVDADITLTATVVYQGYTVVATKTISIKAKKITPVSLVIDGATQVMEGGQSSYTATATMSNGSAKVVTPIWSVNNVDHGISLSGILTAGLVNFDTVVTITATYTENGTTVTDTHDVLVKNDPEVWAPFSLAIDGPATVDEGTTTKYQANLTEKSNKGNSRVTPNVSVQWLVNNYGQISSDGNFTAASVNSDASAIISAVYNDGQNLPVTASLTVLVKNIPLLQSLALSLIDISIFGGYTTKIRAIITKLTGNSDVTTSSNISYSSSDPSVTINKTTGDVVTQVTTTTKTVTITATYTEAGETKTATVTLEVKANLADTLTITPASSTIFEGQTVQFNAALALVDGTTKTVTPVWAVDNTNYGAVDTAGLFTSAAVTANVAANITAQYTGPETGGVTKTSNTAVVNITNIAPQSMILYNDAGVYSVNEGSSITLKAKVTFNNSSVQYPTAVTYSLSTADQAYATLSTDPATGVVTITTKDLIADKTITVTGTYANSDAPGGQLTASKAINLKYVRSVIGLDLSITPNGPFYEGQSFSLVLKQKYDDGTFGAAITSGMTWSDVSAYATISNNTITFKTVNADATFTLTATYGGLTSNALSITVKDIAPIGLTITSSAGNTIKRDASTTLTASITMSDGSATNPSPLNPITWQLLDAAAGTLTSNANYTATFKAASLQTDMNFRVQATASGGVSAIETLMVDGYAIPTGATLSGPASVNANATGDYTLTVTMSDGTTRVISPTSTTYSGTFNHTFTGGNITQYGRFTAPNATVDTNGKITASYTDSVSGITVTATDLPIVVKALVALAPSSIAFVNPATTVASGSTTDFEIAVTMTDGTTRNISPTKTTYTATWTTTITGASSPVNGRLVAPGTNTDVSGTITASYTLNGVTKTASTPVTVKAAIGTSLTLSPTTISIFEGKTQQITATLNTGVAPGVTVTPTRWVVGSALLGSVNATGLFTASTVSADSTTNITAYYTGAQTNNVEVSGTINSVTIKDIAPTTVDVYNDTASYTVNEGATITLKSKITFNDGSIVDAPATVTYAITSGSAYATISTTNGVVTVTGGTVTANQTVTITATYTAPDGKTKTGTRNITVSNSTKLVTGLVVDTTQTAPYYEGTNLTLRVREQYDDGSYSTNITSGVTWTVSNPALATVTGVTAALGAVTGDQTITFTGSYGGRTAPAFSVTITDIVPASVQIISSTGSFTVKREASASFTAKITMNNGTQVNADATNPVTWTNNGVAGIGTLTTNGQAYDYTAAASDVDKTFTITATTANSKTATSTVTLDGYPVPVSAVISGAATVNAGTTSQYTATVNMSDGTTRTLNATTTTGAAWSETFTNGSINASTGLFTAGSPATAENGNIKFTYTDATSGRSVTAPDYAVTVAAVTTAPPSSVFADAVYVGTVGRSLNKNPDGTASGMTPTATTAANIATVQGDATNKALFEAWLTKWLQTTDPNNTSSKYLTKVGDATKKFAAQTIVINRGALTPVSYPADNYDAAFMFWPQSRTASGNLQTDSVNTFNSASLTQNIVPTGSITLTVNGSAMVFDYYLYTVSLTTANTSATLYARCI